MKVPVKISFMKNGRYIYMNVELFFHMELVSAFWDA